jgi:hypothetical protein
MGQLKYRGFLSLLQEVAAPLAIGHHAKNAKGK